MKLIPNQPSQSVQGKSRRAPIASRLANASILPLQPIQNISSLNNKIINAIPDAIVVVDLEQRIMAINPAFTKLWGYSFGEVKGKLVRILYDASETFDWHDPRNYYFQEESTAEHLFTHHYRRKDGSLFYGDTYGSPIRDYYGNILGYLGTTRPAVFNKLQALLQANDSLLKLAFNNAIDAILWSHPATSIITDCNLGAEQLLQTDKDKIIGQPQVNFFSPDSQFDLLQLIQKPIGCATTESEVITAAGKKIPVRITATVIMVQGQTTVQCICHDINKEKMAAQAIEKENFELEKKIYERTLELEETNTALKILLKKGEVNRKELAAEILNNLRELIDPSLRKLDRTALTKSQRNHLKTISDKLDELSSPFICSISSSIRQLTPTETKVAAFIMQGLTSKDIAEALGISPWTVDVHRRNIRKKCGITNKQVNLRSALTSLIE